MFYEVAIEGLEPGLVMNNPAGMGGSTTVPKAEVEAEQKCYRMAPNGRAKKGELYIPGEAVMACILSVSAPFKLRMRGKVTACKRWLAGGALIRPAQVPLGVDAYEVYVVPAVVDRRRILRARARVFPWKASFRIAFSDADPLFDDVAQALEPRMREMLTLAGIMAGLLDNRPGAPKKPGPHGRFKVVRCDLVDGKGG